MPWGVDYVPMGGVTFRRYPRGTYTILPQGSVYRLDGESVFVGMLVDGVALPTDFPAFEIRPEHQTIVYPMGGG